jgi:hypothetical protein
MPVRFGLSWRSSWPDQASRDDQAWHDQAWLDEASASQDPRANLYIVKIDNAASYNEFFNSAVFIEKKMWGIDSGEKVKIGG